MVTHFRNSSLNLRLIDTRRVPISLRTNAERTLPPAIAICSTGGGSDISIYVRPIVL